MRRPSKSKLKPVRRPARNVQPLPQAALAPAKAAAAKPWKVVLTLLVAEFDTEEQARACFSVRMRTLRAGEKLCILKDKAT